MNRLSLQDSCAKTESSDSLSFFPLLISPSSLTTSTISKCRAFPGSCIVPGAATHALNTGAEYQAQVASPLGDGDPSGCGGEGYSLGVTYTWVQIPFLPLPNECLGDSSLHLPEPQFSSSGTWGSL